MKFGLTGKPPNVTREIGPVGLRAEVEFIGRYLVSEAQWMTSADSGSTHSSVHGEQDDWSTMRMVGGDVSTGGSAFT